MKIKIPKISKYSNRIKNIDDLLADIRLRDECLNFFSLFSGTEGNYAYGVDNKEKKELVFLLKDLGLITPDFDADEDEPQEIIVSLHPKKVIEFLDRVKGKKAAIRKEALELIAQHIGNLTSGNKLVEFLRDLGVPESLIMYPNTKWRMVYDVLLYYASCPKFKDQKMLFKIIEETSHPLMHNGDKTLAEETKKKFNGLLEYDKFWLNDGILWAGWDNGVDISWSDKDGNLFEDINSNNIYFIFPKKNDKLYVYWNELIKLVKFYFNNKDSQDDEINNIYFELINKVEKLVNGVGCGGINKIYKRPFGNIIGCEFEAQKQGLTPDGLFVKLYDFLSIITNTSLPNKENVEKIKKDDVNFFIKINEYCKRHLAKIEKNEEIKQELPTTRIEIVKLPEIQIKKDGKLLADKRNGKEKNIYLNQFGDLYKEPKNKFCYPMGEKEDRHKIVRHILTNKGYQQTSQIALIFDNKNEDSIISEIGKINSISRGKLTIKDNIILGKKGSGYRANPDYKFSLKNE